MQLLHSRRVQVSVAAGMTMVLAVTAMWLLSPRDTASVSATPTLTASPRPTARATVPPSAAATASPAPTPEPAARCPLNGLPAADPALLDRTALAVQIENHPAARPARNLTRADMVVEATVEGDTTRFTAVFLCQPTLGMTGPIRSARYYNIDLWQDLGVLTVGFGASNGALSRFRAAGMPYANGITGAWPWFRRHGTNAAPHNLYGDVEAVRAALGSNAALDRLAANVRELRPQLAFDPEPEVPRGRAVARLEIRTNSYWRIGWRFDEELGAWRRLDAGVEIHDEATGQPVTARTVVVQRVTQETVYDDPDPAGNPRRLQHLVGSGSGTLYVDGTAIDVRWSRPAADAGTTWTYADSGEPVVLPPGVVWWEIVPVGSSLTEA
ncbi:MAG TPA: DUF3048 domain-containing protein [candidate division Zixibacteria bacterium]|nr:DUF3048 domain-containing protein [candidate division Zixibacteria bacterium]